MTRRAFIQANRKQHFGAKLARFALNKHSPSLPVEIMRVEEYPEFRAFEGTEYRHNGRLVRYDPNDLQSFTLSRFKPPELMGYEGEALVIDPDIFAIQDVMPIFDLPRGGKPIVACTKKDAYDSSVMVLDCAKLSWKVPEMLDALSRKERDYADYSTLRFEKESVAEMPRLWNSLDMLSSDTRFLHTTGRLTQPWKTGLKIDFRREPLGKKFGVIPREWIYRLLGRYPSRYQPHPDAKITGFFFALAKEALAAGAITDTEIGEEIRAGHIRPDFMEAMG